MATPTTYANTYNFTTGLYLDIEPMIHLLSPYDVPLTGGYGADGRTVLTSGTCFEKKVEWLDEVLLTPRTTQTGGAATTGQTTLTAASGDGKKFGIGDVIAIGGTTEIVYVSGVSTDTLTVTRGYNSTTAATVASGASLIGVGTALAEGSNPQAAKMVDRSNRFNYTQIFGPYGVQASGTEQVVRKYGISDAGTTEFEHQVSNRLKEGAVAIEQAVLYGSKMDDTSSVGTRMMGGFREYITTNVDSSTTTITEATLLAQVQAAYDAGGLPDRLVVGSKQKRIISQFFGVGGSTSTPITLDIARGDNGRGQVVDYYDTDFGRLSIVLDRWCNTPDAFGFNRDQAEICTLRPFQFEPLAKTGDRIEGQIVGEKTLRFRRERHAFRFSALT